MITTPPVERFPSKVDTQIYSRIILNIKFHENLCISYWAPFTAKFLSHVYIFQKLWNRDEDIAKLVNPSKTESRKFWRNQFFNSYGKNRVALGALKTLCNFESLSHTDSPNHNYPMEFDKSHFYTHRCSTTIPYFLFLLRTNITCKSFLDFLKNRTKNFSLLINN